MHALDFKTILFLLFYNFNDIICHNDTQKWLDKNQFIIQKVPLLLLQKKNIKRNRNKNMIDGCRYKA